MKRRRLVVAGVGGAAAATGIGVAVWREAPGPAFDDRFWEASFPSPDGSRLVMASFKGRPLVLNFWATWCPPCVREMPELDRFAQAYRGRGWQVVGLAVDAATPVREFLARTRIGFPIGLAGFDGTDISRKLGNTSGALPFTVVFDRQGRPRQRKLGETSLEQLQSWALQH